MSCITIFFFKLTVHHIRHRATHKFSCPPGDCIHGHFTLPQGFMYVCMYGLCGYAPPKYELMLNVCWTGQTFSINSYLVSAL